MHKLFRSCLFAAFLVVVGCASVSEDDLPYLLPVGSEVTLTQTIDARSGARINIQSGQVAVRGELQIVYPYCLFQVRRSPEEMGDSLVIEEDTFTVKKVFRQADYIAATGMQFAAGFDASRSLSTVMEISSERQPFVENFVCVKWGNPTRDRYVSLNEMRTALGSLVVLSPQ